MVALQRLLEAATGSIVAVEQEAPVPIVRIKTAYIVPTCRFLKDDPACAMALLADLCGVDRLGQADAPERFDVVYQLFSLRTRERLRLKAAVAEGGEIATVTGVWRGANWHEREAFDMFGIRFAGHPDPRRILMPEDFDAYPLRKDFPLEGRTKDHGSWRKPSDDDRDGAGA